MRVGACKQCGRCCENFVLYDNQDGKRIGNPFYVLQDFPFFRLLRYGPNKDGEWVSTYTCAAPGPAEVVDGVQIRQCMLYGQAEKPEFCDRYPTDLSDLRKECGFSFEEEEGS